MDVEARVAQLRDLLGQQLHAIHRVAEDDGLVDLELRRHQQDRDEPANSETTDPLLQCMISLAAGCNITPELEKLFSFADCRICALVD